MLTCVNPSDSAGLAGLAITAALNLTGLMNWTVRQSTELEVQMNRCGLPAGPIHARLASVQLGALTLTNAPLNPHSTPSFCILAQGFL